MRRDGDGCLFFSDGFHIHSEILTQCEASTKSEDEENAVQVLGKGRIALGPCYSECGPYQD